MSTPRGIFESFPGQPSGRQESPFAVVSESPAPSPFQAVAAKESPFAAADEANRGGKLPERRKTGESPFQITDPKEGFGFEAPAPVQAYAASPFEVATAPPPFEAAPAPAPSPFSAAPAPASTPTSPFAIASEPRPAAPAQAFGGWPSATPPAAPAGLTPTQAAIAAFATPPPPAPVQPPSVFSAAAAPAPAPAPQQYTPPAPAPAPAPAPTAVEGFSDSSTIRQLELRAIFGVDREMSVDEILQRARALPGVRTIARVAAEDIGSVEALKSLLSNLGFGGGSLKLYSGSVPIEFIREGNALLAVQTDGGFAPGVRETLMIVARELNRM